MLILVIGLRQAATMKIMFRELLAEGRCGKGGILKGFKCVSRAGGLRRDAGCRCGICGIVSGKLCGLFQVSVSWEKGGNNQIASRTSMRLEERV